MIKTIHLDLPIELFENLLWILLDWGYQPATSKESATPDEFNELVSSLQGVSSRKQDAFVISHLERLTCEHCHCS